MPPKKQDKAALKAKQKVVEDKTFGLKNKNKSTKVQKYVQQVQQQGTQQRKPGADESKKDREQKRKEELADLFKPVQLQKVPFGVDPKTVMCQFFKAGLCTKGKSCKFSHDTNIERKSTKIDIYTDARAVGDNSATAAKADINAPNPAETMENWDQAQLEDVVNRKHGKQTTTDIVCKYFLQAVEERKYGWFWQCPNGGDTCKYKHALPPGFVLKEKGKKKTGDDEVVQSLEEWIEEQRTHLPQKVTPVSLETFNEWKKKRQLDKEKQELEFNRQREAAVKAGKSIGASGRELFTYNPEMFNAGEDDDDEAMDIDYTQREESDQEGGDGTLDHAGVKRPHASETGIDVAAFEGVSLEDLEDGL